MSWRLIQGGTLPLPICGWDRRYHPPCEGKEKKEKPRFSFFTKRNNYLGKILSPDTICWVRNIWSLQWYLNYLHLAVHSYELVLLRVSSCYSLATLTLPGVRIWNFVKCPKTISRIYIRLHCLFSLSCWMLQIKQPLTWCGWNLLLFYLYNHHAQFAEGTTQHCNTLKVVKLSHTHTR